MLKSIAARRGAGMFSEHVEYTGIGWDWTKIRSLNSYIDVFAGAGWRKLGVVTQIRCLGANSVS